LVEKGYLVLFPSTEHAPSDLVAYDGQKFIRMQVKYRSSVKGVLLVNLINWRADKNGCHGKRVEKSQVDVFCIYCPDTGKCYYFSTKDINVSLTFENCCAKE